MYSQSQCHIHLLSDQEIKDLYAAPQFNYGERTLYFSLTDKEMIIVKKYRTVKAQIYFVRLLGYFKAKQQFYKFELEADDDTQYILKKYFNKNTSIQYGQIDIKTYQKQKNDILMLLDFIDWLPKHAPKIQSHLGGLIKLYPKTHDALRHLLNYFDTQRIVLPSYRTLQDLFTQSVAIEEARLNALISVIPELIKEQLSSLIAKEDGISPLNVIRSDQKNFKYTAIKEETAKALGIVALYGFAKSFLPDLNISKNAIRYYADLSEQYAAFRLRRVSKSQQWLQALCFVYHRYQQIMDNLITSFIFHTRAIIADGKTEADRAMAEYSSELVVDLPKVANFLKWFPNRKRDLSHDELNHEAYNILPEEQFPALSKFLEGRTFDKKAVLRSFYLKSARLFALYLRPIVLTVPFVFYKNDSKIMALINLIKKHYGCGKSPAAFKLPSDLEDVIPKAMLPYLKQNPDDEHVDPHLFEFFVYQKMYRRLDKNLLCCNESISYCDVDHDLIDDALVDDAEKIANQFGYPNIPIYCDKHLDEVLELLDNAWERTTERITMGENAGFKIKETTSGEQEWSLLYDGVDKLDDAFFKTLPQVEIPDVVMHIGDHINMWCAFTHMKTRYNKRKSPDIVALIACLLSDAFGIGTEKMAEMSDMIFSLLRSTQEDFIRVDTLCAASDMASNLLHSLPIFKQWNLMNEKLLADADGQKLPTSESTLQSRYSTKYLGKDPGLSVYTLIANFIAVNAKNIGLNEYEGHSLFDIIFGNNTDIDIDMVTGDNHSLNQLNFVILDAIGVDYVPSIKNIKEASNDLFSFKLNDAYTGIIRAKGVIDPDLIRSERRGILRVLLSLLLQENTQSNIVKKINSSARYIKLKKALFEYNKALKSMHVLNLIDNMSLRQAIRAARNRTEAYHQLQGLIRKIYRGVFKGRKVVNNRVSAHAVRLIANCIIAHNGIILNTIYEKMLSEGVSQEIIDEFLRISPIAWAHIAFTGKYSFKKSNGRIDIASMVEAMEKHLKRHFWKLAVPITDTM
ncbi:MAG: Tn3 family transposase [Legionella sp.]|nr:Tn3 family transposase [Legionella sp.]